MKTISLHPPYIYKEKLHLLLVEPYIHISEEIAPTILDILENNNCVAINSIKTKRNRAFVLKVYNEELLIKVYFHGGGVKYFLPSMYFFKNRGLDELKFYIHNLNNQNFVPQYIGAFWIKKMPFYITGTISKYIPNTEDLESILTNPHKKSSEKDIISEKVGSTIRFMHDRGIYHRDLHLKNILIKNPECLISSEVFIIDFDKAKIKKTMGLFWRTLNLLRLKRYFFKTEIPLGYYNHILKGYNIQKLSVVAEILSLPHLLLTKLRSL
ncbi:MAG: protein kinase [Candidatus Hydrogenedentes bacterium]|nr:protein kinase [Candidatus Hydrogenedentota bacterium]